MELHYKQYGQGFPVIILHGLFGSLSNWQSIAKALASPESTAGNSLFHVFIVDQRNHGRTAHSDSFSYELLSEDVNEFLAQHSIVQAHVIGHSMGGKAAMRFALEHPDKVNKLVVVDIAPSAYEDGHSYIFNALFAADVQTKATRAEVEEVLRLHLKNDEATIQFLMQNLQRATSGNTGFEWRFNLEALHKNYSLIAGTVDAPAPFEGKTLFVKGEKSPYINSSNYSDILRLFPNHQLTEIKNAGHWLHADQPAAFVEAISNFLQE